MQGERSHKHVERVPSATFSHLQGYVDTVRYYDPRLPGWYYPNRDSNTVVAFLFDYPSACSLLGVGVNCYSPGWAELYVWEGPDSIPVSTEELQDHIDAHWEYDCVLHEWISWPAVLYGPVLIGSDEPGDFVERIAWHEVSPLDVGTHALWVGYRIITRYSPSGVLDGGRPWPISDGWVEPAGRGPHYVPCRSWMMMDHPYLGYCEWRPYGDLYGDWKMEFAIHVYANSPPTVRSFDELRSTYDTGDRVVTAHIEDRGVPPESSGVAEVWLIYHLNDDAMPSDSLPMSLIDGSIENGTWEATLPGQSAETKVTYYFSVADLQGLQGRTQNQAHFYYVREGTPGNILLLCEDDAYYGGQYSHDPVNAVAQHVDMWDALTHGAPDSSVLSYYHPSGPGQPIIFWFADGGSQFREETDFLSGFLDAGGKLFLSSQNLCDFNSPTFGEHWDAPPGHFIREYMRAHSGWDDYYTGDSTFYQYGVSGDTITGSPLLSEIVVYPYYWAGPGYNSAGMFEELDSACVPIFYDSLPAVMGYRYEDTVSGYKVIWVYWPIQYIVLTNGGIQDNREAQDTLIARTLRWFGYLTRTEEEPSSQELSLTLCCAPNPLRDRTYLAYGLPGRSEVRIVIYNILGQEIITLLRETQEAGRHTVAWDGKDDSGSEVPSGPYFVRLSRGGSWVTERVLVLK